MPLLTCPNDNAPMQALNRQGVELDICPQCRGVWLDRGELEKLMGMARSEEDGRQVAAVPPPAPHQQRRPDPRYVESEYGERGEQGERGDFDARGQRRKRGFDFFDIFD